MKLAGKPLPADDVFDESEVAELRRLSFLICSS